FLLSGATGLVYELLWVRLLYQAFGSTVQSVTTVVAAYMGGLGLGAWLLGRWADRHARPAALYGGLEIAIGVFGLVSPLVLSLAHRVYVAAAGAWQLSGAASVALRFGLAALVLLVPTTLMGGTLPVLTRAFMGADRAALQPSLGRLYGLNTLGAARLSARDRRRQRRRGAAQCAGARGRGRCRVGAGGDRRRGCGAVRRVRAAAALHHRGVPGPVAGGDGAAPRPGIRCRRSSA